MSVKLIGVIYKAFDLSPLLRCTGIAILFITMVYLFTCEYLHPL